MGHLKFWFKFFSVSDGLRSLISASHGGPSPREDDNKQGGHRQLSRLVPLFALCLTSKLKYKVPV